MDHAFNHLSTDHGFQAKTRSNLLAPSQYLTLLLCLLSLLFLLGTTQQCCRLMDKTAATVSIRSASLSGCVAGQVGWGGHALLPGLHDRAAAPHRCVLSPLVNLIYPIY